MKIIEEYNDLPVRHIEVRSAKYIGDFVLRIFFNDNTQQLVDFKSFLQSSLHPSIRKYLDENIFKNFQIIDGNLNWKIMI